MISRILYGCNQGKRSIHVPNTEKRKKMAGVVSILAVPSFRDSRKN